MTWRPTSIGCSVPRNDAKAYVTSRLYTICRRVLLQYSKCRSKSAVASQREMREERKGGGEAKRNDVAFDVLETPCRRRRVWWPLLPFRRWALCRCFFLLLLLPSVGVVTLGSSLRYGERQRRYHECSKYQGSSRASLFTSVTETQVIRLLSDGRRLFWAAPNKLIPVSSTDCVLARRAWLLPTLKI